MSLFDEQELNQKLLKLALDTSWAGVLIADKEGQYLYANPRYEELTGWASEMIRQMDSKTLRRHLIREKISTVELVLEQKREVLLVQSSTSDDKVFLVRGVPYFDARGEVAYIICHLLELSALQRYTGSLEASRVNRRPVYEDSVRIVDEDGPHEEKIIFKSRAMRQVVEQISLVAQTDVAVFIQGEPGVGKELFAKRLHDSSSRRDQPFVKFNCGSGPETVLAGELFGREGAGSAKAGKGLLEYASGGTVLLDGAEALPLSLQTKLLRILQEKKYTKLGGSRPVRADVRFIAAGGTDIEKKVREGAFREDLYYRLNIIPIRIPALRERREDVPLLAGCFLQQLNEKYRKQKTLTPEGLEAIAGKPFPGNVRQLRSFLERMVLLAANDSLTAEDVDRFYSVEAVQEDQPESGALGRKTLQEMMDDYEKYVLTEYKKKFKSSRQVARQLGTNQSTISRKFQKYHL